jgi:3-oxoacyl-[acyl-carrier-protein] synthase III
MNNEEERVVTKVILGTGSYLPQRRLDNDALEEIVDDYDRERAGSSLHDWAMKRAGIAARHIVAPGEGAAAMAASAARAALDDARVGPEEIDLLVLSTFTGDYCIPSSVSLVQAELGVTGKCFQLEAACAGFIDATIVAAALIDTGQYARALVVHTEVMSSIVDPKRFLEQAVFGDGAAAAVLAASPDPAFGIKAAVSHTDGTIARFTYAPMGRTLAPIDEQVLRDRSQYLRVQHREVFDFAVEKFVDSTNEVLDRAGKSVADLDWWIPHQTGLNIMETAAAKLGLALDRMQVSIEETGNTSGATIPMALDIASRRGDLRSGDQIVLSAVGGGMAWGALYMVWADAELRHSWGET